ncbi:hypothetical protein BH23CHL9_BH23CHL9_16870 [soil metagenome]
MNRRPGRDRTESERYPSRRLSSIGGITTGWRSSLETNPRERFSSFLIGSLVAMGSFALLALLLA